MTAVRLTALAGAGRAEGRRLRAAAALLLVLGIAMASGAEAQTQATKTGVGVATSLAIAQEGTNALRAQGQATSSLPGFVLSVVVGMNPNAPAAGGERIWNNGDDAVLGLAGRGRSFNGTNRKSGGPVTAQLADAGELEGRIRARGSARGVR